MTNIKVVIIGDSCVGKSTLARKYVDAHSPSKDTTFDSYTCNINHKKKNYVLHIWDTAGREEMDKLRSLSYPHTDIFLICYAIDNLRSFNNVPKYISEIRDYNSKCIIVGCKNDLRQDRITSGEIIDEERANRLAKENGCVALCTSAEENYNVKEVFQQCVNVYNEPRQKRSKRAWWRCLCCKGNDT